MADARNQALAVFQAYEPEPTEIVTYRSAGKLLALGDAAALGRCAAFDGLDIETIEAEQGSARVEGHLGAFRVQVNSADGAREYRGDAVLDLGATPLLNRELPPPGYFHFTGDAWDDAARVAELGEELGALTGEFQKPRYFDYDASICAHHVNGREVCRRCIDACPAEAIISIGERIEVDANLCQGGGTCTTACPSGAIRYRYPSLRDNGKRLRRMLVAFREAGGADPVVLFHAEHTDPAAYLELSEAVLPVALEELASVGPELWLSAIAYGARQVVLYLDDSVPPTSAVNLREQVGWMQELLRALGLPADCISLYADGDMPAEVTDAPTVTAAEYDMLPGKREGFMHALDHLVAQLRPAADSVALAAPAPFGEAAIDAEKCTLCMACVGACPGRALQDGSNREIPEVFFIESNCLQCGACVQTCPEDAIALTPRLVFDAEARNKSRALNQDTPFGCISCGKPFAPASVIAKMQEKLKDHYMFSDSRALDRLKMCEDCRVVDIMQDPDAMGGQFDPGQGFRQ